MFRFSNRLLAISIKAACVCQVFGSNPVFDTTELAPSGSLRIHEDGGNKAAQRFTTSSTTNLTIRQIQLEIAAVVTNSGVLPDIRALVVSEADTGKPSYPCLGADVKGVMTAKFPLEPGILMFHGAITVQPETSYWVVFESEPILWPHVYASTGVPSGGLGDWFGSEDLKGAGGEYCELGAGGWAVYSDLLRMSISTVSNLAQTNLIITGVMDGTLSGGTPKTVELYARADIADLSQYALSRAGNGSSTFDTITADFILPAISLSAGDFYYAVGNSFGDQTGQFDTVWPAYAGIRVLNFGVNSNGDDVTGLFHDATGAFTGSETLVDVMGELGVDGSGTVWDHLDGWAYSISGRPPTATFDINEWYFSGPNAMDGFTPEQIDVSFPDQEYGPVHPPPLDGLVAYYSFNEGDATDSTSSGHDGAVNGATWTADGALGGGFTFDGVDDHIRIPDHPELNPEVFTMTHWVKLSQPTGFRGSFAKTRESAASLYRAIFDGGNVYFSLRVNGDNSGWLSTPFATYFEQWTMVTVMYNGTNTRMYINDQLVRQAALSAGLLVNIDDVLIGAGAFNIDGDLPVQLFQGQIDEVRFYNRELSSEEIAVLYQYVLRGGLAPSIVEGPHSRTNVVGSTAVLSVTATGTEPLSYQWFKDAQLVPDANSSTLALSNIQLIDAGSYTATVSNVAGVVTSDPAVLTVLPAPMPGVLAGPIVNPANGHAYYLLEPSSWTDAEAQAVLLGGHLATINDQDENDWVFDRWGAERRLWIGLSDAATEGSFEWVSGEDATYRNWRSGEPNDSSAGDDYVYMLAGSSPIPVPSGVWNDIGDLSAYPNGGPLFYGVVELEGPIAGPTIVIEPQSRTTVEGSAVAFSVHATGMGQLSYQWFKDAEEIFGAISSTLVLLNVQLADAGTYSVVVSDELGMTRSPAVMAVVQPVAPSVLARPIVNHANGHEYYLLEQSTWVEAQMAAAGLGGYLTTIDSSEEHDFVFTNFSNWSETERCLWIGLYDPDPVNNATGRVERMAEFVWANAELVTYSNWAGTEPNNYREWGEFYVHMLQPGHPSGGLWNDTWDSDFNQAPIHGVVERNEASVSPAIVVQPQSRTNVVGSAVALSVTATGTAPLSYQWFKDTQAVPGATSSAMVIANVQLSDAGSYTVIVTNLVGSVISSPGVLTIVPQDIPGVLAGPIVNPANGHEYYLLEQSTWVEAQNASHGLAGYLTTINNVDEQAWVFDQFSDWGGQERGLWIGLHDADPVNNSDDPVERQAEFVWTDGDPSAYVNWQSGQPNNYAGFGEFYAHMRQPSHSNAGMWNDASDTQGSTVPLQGVVEVLKPTVAWLSESRSVTASATASVYFDGEGADDWDEATTSPLTPFSDFNEIVMVGANAVYGDYQAGASGEARQSSAFRRNGFSATMEGTVFAGAGPGGAYSSSGAGSRCSATLALLDHNDFFVEGRAWLAHTHTIEQGTLELETDFSTNFNILKYGGIEFSDSGRLPAGIYRFSAAASAGVRADKYDGGECTCEFSFSLDFVATSPEINSVLLNNYALSAWAPVFGPEPADPRVFLQGNPSNGLPAGSQTYTGGPLNGTNWVVELWGVAGTEQPEGTLQYQASTQIQALDEELQDLWGLFLGGSVALEDIPDDQPATFQVRVYDGREGTVSSWGQALTDPAVLRGYSRPITVAAAPVRSLTGLESFNVHVPADPVATAPAFYVEPESQAVALGEDALFSALVVGTQPIAYQWFHADGLLSGATNDSMTLAGVGYADSGNYQLVASNAFGVSTSAVAILTVEGPPAIVQQLEDIVVPKDQDVLFQVIAEGTAPVHYQWRFGGVDLMGATSASVLLTNVQPAQSGLYSVVVSNAYGTATSSNALLTVLPVSESQVQVVLVSGMAGSSIAVPIRLVSVGTENALGFSMEFDPALLTVENTQLGAGATGGALLVNNSQTNAGRLGMAISLPSGGQFSAGTNELVVVTFSSSPVSNAVVTPIVLGDQPTVREVVDPLAAVLPASYRNGVISLTPAQYEGDLAPRSSGDGVLSVGDWVQAGRFVAVLDTPEGEDEYRRVDSAPRASLGDGRITLIDWVQAGRYAVGLDPLTLAGGPVQNGQVTAQQSSGGVVHAQNGESVRTVDVSASALVAGSTNSVAIELEALGDENALAFSVQFDPALLSYTGATLGSDAGGAILNINASSAGSGELGLALSLPIGTAFDVGANELVTVEFGVPAEADGSTTITFADSPIWRETSDALASPLPTIYQSGTLNITPLLPLLSITLEGEEITLSWPSTFTEFTLESTENLSNPDWDEVNESLSTNGDSVSVTLPITNTRTLYRLKKD